MYSRYRRASAIAAGSSAATLSTWIANTFAPARSAPAAAEMVDTLVSWNVSILFTIGGDGTQRGAHEIAQEIRKRKVVVHTTLSVGGEVCARGEVVAVQVPNRLLAKITGAR